MKGMKKPTSVLTKYTPASRIPAPAVGKVHKPLTCPHLLQKEITWVIAEKARQHVEPWSGELGAQKFTFLTEIEEKLPLRKGRPGKAFRSKEGKLL